MTVEKRFDPYHKWLGIPAEEQPPHLYRLLGLALFESDPEVIEAAADQRMAHVRTYQLGKHAAVSQCILNELADAKLRLLESQAKAEYDAALQKRLETEAASSQSTPHPSKPAASPSPAPLTPIPLRQQSPSASPVGASPAPSASVEEPFEIVRRRDAGRPKSWRTASLVIGCVGAIAFAAILWQRQNRSGGRAADRIPAPRVQSATGQDARGTATAQPALVAARSEPELKKDAIAPELITAAPAPDQPPPAPEGKKARRRRVAKVDDAPSAGKEPEAPEPPSPAPEPARSLGDLLSKEASSSISPISPPQTDIDKPAVPRPRLAPKDAIFGNGRWYWFSPATATFEEAQAVAVKLKGRLLTISSEEENAFIAARLKGPTFLGLLKIKGLWMNSQRSRQEYFNWDRGQPSSGPAERFAAIHMNGRWHDYNRDALYFCVEWGKER